MKSAKTADPWKRLFSLFANIMELVVADKRNAEEVADVLQVIKNDRNFAITLGRTTLSVLAKDQLADWAEFYHEEFGIVLDVRSLEGKIPAHKNDFDRLIVVPGGITFEKILNQLKKRMFIRNNWSNSGSFASARKADRDYAVWVRDRHEADEELVNKSASALGVEKVNCITLEERLLLESFCFWAMGVHLDVQSFTLCAGSYDRGCLPKVAYVKGDVVIDWVISSDNCSTHRGRQVVS
jgi:hypothetical protein